MARTFPVAGDSPIDITDTITMVSGGSYASANIETVTAGTGAAWVSALYAKITQGATKNVNGYFCAGEFELVNSAPNESANFVMVLNSNNSGANPSAQRSYIALRDYGSADCEAFLWLGPEIEAAVGTKSATTLFSTNVATVATHHLRIVVNGTPYFIMLTNTAAT